MFPLVCFKFLNRDEFVASYFPLNLILVNEAYFSQHPLCFQTDVCGQQAVSLLLLYWEFSYYVFSLALKDCLCVERGSSQAGNVFVGMNVGCPVLFSFDEKMPPETIVK